MRNHWFPVVKYTRPVCYKRVIINQNKTLQIFKYLFYSLFEIDCWCWWVYIFSEIFWTFAIMINNLFCLTVTLMYFYYLPPSVMDFFQSYNSVKFNYIINTKITEHQQSYSNFYLINPVFIKLNCRHYLMFRKIAINLCLFSDLYNLGIIKVVKFYTFL